MTALGIALMGIGLALICAGLAFWPRTARSEPEALDGPDEFRAILDALDAQDRRHENGDLDEPAADRPAWGIRPAKRQYTGPG